MKFGKKIIFLWNWCLTSKFPLFRILINMNTPVVVWNFWRKITKTVMIHWLKWYFLNDFLTQSLAIRLSSPKNYQLLVWNKKLLGGMYLSSDDSRCTILRIHKLNNHGRVIRIEISLNALGTKDVILWALAKASPQAWVKTSTINKKYKSFYIFLQFDKYVLTSLN